MIDEVKEVDTEYIPDSGAPSPLLVKTDSSTLLTFDARRKQPDLDGMRELVGTALVEFTGCVCTQFGYPNDEALPGHHLYSNGLQTYGIFEVLNSSWIDRLTEQNRVRFPDTKKNSSLRHFIFVFHDSTFECVAKEFKLQVLDVPYKQVFGLITERVLNE